MFKGESGGSKKEQPADPVSLMVKSLSDVPRGVKKVFRINFGPGLAVVDVTAYIDPRQSQLRIEGLPEEYQRFLRVE